MKGNDEIQRENDRQFGQWEERKLNRERFAPPAEPLPPLLKPAPLLQTLADFWAQMDAQEAAEEAHQRNLNRIAGQEIGDAMFRSPRVHIF